MKSERIVSFTRRVKCCCGNLHVEIGFNKNRLCKIVIDLRNSDSCKREHARAIGLLVTELLKKKVSTGLITKELEAMRCFEIVSEGKMIPCCTKIVAGILRYYS